MYSLCYISKNCSVGSFVFSFLRSRLIPATYRCSLQLCLLGITDVIFGITTFLQMARRQQLEDTGAHYEVPKTLAGPGGSIRLMDRRPNSGPYTPCPPLPDHRVQPGDLPPICLERERARTYRMTSWDGPRYPAFSTDTSRLRSFAKRSWPHPKLSPNSFSAAGLFYTGKDLGV